jgi:glycosyltransferase involved in cell wall biosynthesis
MDRGGVETWLMHVLHHVDRTQFNMDFLVATDWPCAYDDEIRGLGSRVLPCLHPRRPWVYARNFYRTLRQFGPFDIVHCHLQAYSGWVLRLAGKAGVRVRIAHSHLAPPDCTGGFLRQTYLRLMSRWIQQYATDGLAASRVAAESLFGARWPADGRWRTLYYGIDLEPFRQYVDPATVRAELNIPAAAWVLGHVGRFHPQKNHSFLLEVTAEAARLRPDVRLLLVGDGDLRPHMEFAARRLGIVEKVIFAGVRSDVARLMLGAMDVFVFPSQYEGLPLTLMEAQSAGLPCLCSDVISDEADMVKPLVRRLSLRRSAAEWARAAVTASAPSHFKHQALTTMAASPFNISVAAANLCEFYAGRAKSGDVPPPQRVALGRGELQHG